ncbi:MAG: hypothetical protein J5379_10550 [Clostridiales bacterium]|nr:hypothetical protein [Clostridiales bacterium]
MKRKLFGRRGSTTIFLCIILSAIIVVETVFVAGAYQRKQEVILSEAVSHQVEQILSQFDRDYLDWYGIYALNSVQSGSSVFDAMTEDLNHAEFEYELFGSMSNDDLKKSISEYMRLRGIAFEGSAMMDCLGMSLSQITGSDKLTGVGVAAWLPTLKEYLNNQKKYSKAVDIVKAFCNATGLDEKFSSFWSFMDDLSETWAQNSSAALEIGDTSVVVSLFDPSCIHSLTTAFDKLMDADLPDLADRLLMNEYAAFSFDSRVEENLLDEGWESESNLLGIPFSDIHEENLCDLEYLLVGQSRPAANIHVSFGILLGIRILLDISAFMLDETKKELALGIAEVLSVLITILSGFTITIDPVTLQYVVLFIMAYIKAFRDSYRLISGKSVPLFYNDKVMGALGGFSETYYRDYYRIFLLFVPEEHLLERMRSVIFRDCGGKVFTGVRATGSLRNGKYSVERRFELYENHE